MCSVAIYLYVCTLAMAINLSRRGCGDPIAVVVTGTHLVVTSHGDILIRLQALTIEPDGGVAPTVHTMRGRPTESSLTPAAVVRIAVSDDAQWLAATDTDGKVRGGVYHTTRNATCLWCVHLSRHLPTLCQNE